MTCTSTAKIDTWIADPNTDSYLLPEHMARSTNAKDVECLKVALRMAMQNFLTADQRALLRMRYWQGLSKTEIATHIGVTPSAVCKRLKVAESLLREYITFALKVHKTVEGTLTQIKGGQ